MRGRLVILAILGAAFSVNGVLLLDALTLNVLLPEAVASGAPTVRASASSNEPTLSEAQAKEAAAAYRSLVAELTEQQHALELKTQELAERERQVALIRQELLAQAEQPAPATAPAGVAAQAETPAPQDRFKHLVKTYGGMEPENAARALLELYERDRDVAIDLLLGLPARRAAAVLDAIATSRPAVAAELSVEITRRDEASAE